VHHHLHIEIIVITISSEIAQHAEAPDSRYTIRVTLICSGSSDRHTFFILGRIVNDQSHPCTWRHMDFYRGGQRSLFHQVSYAAHFAANTKWKAADSICRTWAPLKNIYFCLASAPKRIWTAVRLQKWGLPHNSVCVFCNTGSEEN
jgi:hypothetical protein